MSKYTIERSGETPVEIEADRVQTSDTDSRITFYKGTGDKEEVVASFINVQGFRKTA